MTGRIALQVHKEVTETVIFTLLGMKNLYQCGVNKCFEEVFNFIISLISLLCTSLTLSTGSMIQWISDAVAVLFLSCLYNGALTLTATGIEASYLINIFVLFFLNCQAVGFLIEATS